MKKIVFLFFITISINFASSQNYVLQNEILVFGFETQNGKKMVLAKDKNDAYIIYRFGTKNKIELEFPSKNEDSWKKFEYSFYLRGGGIENEGMDLNYVKFSNGEYKYLIYDTYYSINNEKLLGIKITNLKSGEITDIVGKKGTRKGTLIDFRFNKLLKINDEIEE
ncbi:hypothetical protein [Flavobacterium sp.]|uniref:hypothetical protein n=1 Tax=Flavobacterium sp. TaxID=239 RepID=UPI0026266B95|nr:hypothetical protein [Flavobacterium sp.]